jgi:hypothetical protein
LRLSIAKLRVHACADVWEGYSGTAVGIERYLPALCQFRQCPLARTLQE